MPSCKVEGCQYADGGPESAFIRDASKKSGWRSMCREHRNMRRRSAYSPSLDADTYTYSGEVTSPPPASLEALVKAYGLDPSEWEIAAQRISIAPGAKGISKASRSVSLTRRRPVPTLNLEQISLTPTGHYIQPMPKDVRAGIKTALIVPDAHVDYNMDIHGKLYPYHDREAMDIVCQVADIIQPDTIVYLGDMLDCPAWTD